MLPILYAPSSINNTDSQGNWSSDELVKTNGLGFLSECISCSVTEERNGSYELTATVATSDRLINDISVCGFIKVKPNPQDDPQLFEIYKISMADGIMTINAEHVRYIANYNVLWEPNYTGTAEECWEQATDDMEGTNYFTFASDLTSTLTVGSEIAGGVSVGEWLMGVRSSMLDIFGGEYHYDNFTIELLKNRGCNSGVCLRYGANISSYSQEVSSEKLYTEILPELDEVDEDGNDLGVKWTVSMNALQKLSPVMVSIGQSAESPLEHYRTLLYDFTEDCTNDGVKIECYSTGAGWIPSDEGMTAVAQKLKSYAESYLASNDNANTFAEPSFTVTVNTPEGLDSLSECALCDTVSIYYPPTGTTSTAKIIATTYDSLNERYTSLELGTAKKTIADLINVKNIGGA
ncbi:MAG: hypothetical protein LUD19_01985 [Clostridia bacterium]|nr:hypothetical protein [Clostridia bacterium]